MTGHKNIITFDMGGTSCDVALIRDGEPFVASRGKIEGRDLAVPMMDINTVSAGGGTIARVDRFGVLQVGPQSAGAIPGPACYRRGGTMPTITDCNLVVGHLSEDNFLGGELRLDLAAARQAVESKVAAPLDIGVLEAAEGIVRIIEVKMEEAIKAISTMRGHDLRDFVLLAFGGAGPLHAGRIARDLGMAGVVVPLYPGVYSAIGLAMSDVKHDYIQSRMQPLSELTPEAIEAMFARLATTAEAELREDGFAAQQIRIERALDMRYAGQGYEIAMPCSAERLQEAGIAGLRQQFDARHRAMFGHMAPEEPVEVVSYRVRGLGLVPPVDMPRFKPTGSTLADAQRGRRRVRLDGRDLACPIFQREKLDVGLVVPGPAVLDQLDCTTIIYPGQSARVDEWKNLILTRES
jgi:N-methylhydantoinase A